MRDHPQPDAGTAETAIATETGGLFLADISGFTEFLNRSELDHAQGVLTDLFGIVIGGLRPMMQLAKLEGDAAFAYTIGADLDGAALLDTIEQCYFAFRRRAQSIRQATTCECNACRLIPTLNLKFIAHHGIFVRQRIAGREELMGTDIILVHRLLKNSVTDTFGLRGYALFTSACLAAAGLDPGALGMRALREREETIGEIDLHVEDLEARWKYEQERRRVFIARKDADPVLDTQLASPPEVVWEYLTSDRRFEWMEGLTGFNQAHRAGRRGTGTVNHCAHGKDVFIEEIFDWRPVRYFTSQWTPPGATVPLVITIELTPNGEGTLVSWRRRRDQTRKQRESWGAIGEGLTGFWRRSFNRLADVLKQEQQTRA